MPHMTIDLRIARPRRDVVAWWTGFDDDYRARDPREQPHRIKVVERSADRIELLTYWRVPLAKVAVIPETMRLLPNGDFTVDAHFPLGLDQHDDFTLREEEGATRVTIDIAMTARNALGRIMRPLYWHLYGRRMYPRMFREAARLCERDAPVTVTR